MGKTKIKTDDKFIMDCLFRCCGNLILLKEMYPQITRKQLDRFLKKNSNAILLAKSQLLDLAEKGLIENLSSKNDAVKQRAVEFVLSRRSQEYKVDAKMESIIDEANKLVQINAIFGL